MLPFFLERERGAREREEREKHLAPTGEGTCNLGMYPDQELTHNLWGYKTMLQPSEPLGQGGHMLFWKDPSSLVLMQLLVNLGTLCTTYNSFSCHKNISSGAKFSTKSSFNFFLLCISNRWYLDSTEVLTLLTFWFIYWEYSFPQWFLFLHHCKYI